MTSSSGTFNTPNWPSTYPLNFECEWNIILNDANSIIEISFDDDFGIAGRQPDCTRDTLILYDGGNKDGGNKFGPFCHLTRPEPIRSTSNRLGVSFVAGPSHGPTRHGFRAQYRSISVAPPTTVAPPPPTCGGTLTSSSGTFNTPNWPSTYPLNFECEWNIILNDANSIIEISFDDDFGIAGRQPDCTRDTLILYDGGNNDGGNKFGPFCHLTRPEPIRSTSNRLGVSFVAGPSHGPTRHGFRAQYRSISVAPPTTVAPITTMPNMQRTECGGGPLKFTSLSGSLNTFNWPNSPYAINTQCEWDIECPTGAKVGIQFENNFRVAGRMPDCTRDQVKISDCGDETYGPFCHVTPPEDFTSTCNSVHVTFNAGSDRGETRTGFKLNYICEFTTVIPSPTVSPQCGGGDKSLTASSGSIQTLNWPDTPYPIDTECSWDINCPSGVEINFEDDFKIAGRMPDCAKDQLRISGCGTDYGPFCHTTRPSGMEMDCSKINVSFLAGSERGSTRIGFKLNYRCK